MSFSLMLPPSLSVRVRILVPPSTVSLQSATSGCHSLMAQKPPATSHTFGGRAGALIFFWTSSACAKLVVSTSAASAAKPTLSVPIRFLQLQNYGVSWHRGDHSTTTTCRGVKQSDTSQTLEAEAWVQP